jgi:hypothetical protein
VFRVTHAWDSQLAGILARAREDSNLQVLMDYTSQGVMNDLVWWSLDRIISGCHPSTDKSGMVVYHLLLSQPAEESPESSSNGTGLSVPLAFSLTDPTQTRDVIGLQTVAADDCSVVNVSVAETAVRAFLTGALLAHGHRTAQNSVDAFRSCHDPHDHRKLRGCDDLILRPGKLLRTNNS